MKGVLFSKMYIIIILKLIFKRVHPFGQDAGNGCKITTDATIKITKDERIDNETVNKVITTTY